MLSNTDIFLNGNSCDVAKLTAALAHAGLELWPSAADAAGYTHAETFYRILTGEDPAPSGFRQSLESWLGLPDGALLRVRPIIPERPEIQRCPPYDPPWTWLWRR